MSSGGKEPHQEESPPAAVDGDVLRTLAGLNVQAERPIVNRTRRAIRVADETRRIQGKRGRRQAGIALFALGGILVLLAPALWISLDDLLGGEHFGDLPAQVVLFCSFLLLAIVGALAVFWLRNGQEGYRQDH
jgi:hypothetical protein